MINKSKLKGYAIIFTKDNMPLIDNPSTVPDDAWKTLTIEQQHYANVNVTPHLRKRTK